LERIEPQPGPQKIFLSSKADIAIYGGAAGGGKTFALLLEPLRYVTTNPKFSAIFFRRTTTQILNPGGLWDEATRLYPLVGARPRLGSLEWIWPNGGKIKMAHLEHEQSKQNYQGAQVALLSFDELCHFTESQFWYLASRNRSMSGVRGYIRATCNPDADSWVADFISWWIDQKTGFPIEERAGVVRWLLRNSDTLYWADSREELVAQWRDKIPEEDLLPKSVTFIPATLDDNKALMKADPSYRASLLALGTVERERLLRGNWKIRPAAGLYFQRNWVKVVDSAPPDTKWVRGWDLAATKETESNDPDYTESVLIGRSGDNFYIGDHTYMRGSPGEVKAFVKRTAIADKEAGRDVLISLPQDPGQAGKSQAADFANTLLGFRFRCSVESRSTTNGSGLTPVAKSAKISRFGPFSAQAESGSVFCVKGPWNIEFLERLEAFPEANHDDTADATSRAFREFLDRVPGQSMLEIAQKHAAEKTAEPPPEAPRTQFAPGSVEHAMMLLGKRG
jgi:predicted phage terminase large subunit-like protein